MSLKYLAKATLMGALALGGCENDEQNGTDCRIVMNEADAAPLYSKEAVNEYCADNQSDPNKVQESTGSQLLSCIESVDSGGNLLMRDVKCGTTSLNEELDAVYSNEGAYCVPGGVTLYCDGEVPPQGNGEFCEIVPAPDAYYEVYTETADVLNHCQMNTDPAQDHLTCLGLTTDGMSLEKLETNCSDPNLQSKLNTVLENPDPALKGCVTTDADIVCE